MRKPMRRPVPKERLKKLTFNGPAELLIKKALNTPPPSDDKKHPTKK